MKRTVIIVAAAASLAACAKPPVTRAGFLSNYSDMQKPTNADVHANVRVWQDHGGLAQVRRVRIEPTRMAADAARWMTPAEQVMLLREVDAQLCYALSRTYDIVADGGPADAYVRAAVTRVKPTGRVASGVSAAASKMIPFVPISVRAPVGLGALGAEAEMIQDDPHHEQLAAIRWGRQAQVVGDVGSTSRIGDALQFASAFGEAVDRQFAPPGAQARTIDEKADPCAKFGPRARPQGWIAKLATGLYMPEMSKAKAAKAPEKGPDPFANPAGPVQAADAPAPAPAAETPPATAASAVVPETSSPPPPADADADAPTDPSAAAAPPAAPDQPAPPPAEPSTAPSAEPPAPPQ